MVDLSSIEKVLYFLQGEMERPMPYGWFHILWIALSFVAIFVLFKLRHKKSEKQLKIVLATYGITAFILEALKQIIWSFNYDVITNTVSWDYLWYAFPFQLCTTPIFISLICLFLSKTKLREALLSYMAYFTILGSIMTIILPDSCFVNTILVNIHTMYLHCGSFVVSVYLLITKEVKITKNNFIKAFIVFIIFVYLAELLNIIIYYSGVLNGENFNMFYISPFFMTHLPVFNILQENLPFLIYLLSYILILTIGALIVYFTAKLIDKYINIRTYK